MSPVLSESRSSAGARARPADPSGAPVGSAWLVASYLAWSVLFFLPALAPGVTIFGTDYLAGSYFFEHFVTERFAAGELPKWLPTVYGGMPFFANPMDTYYPLTLLLRVLGVETYRHLAIIFVVQFFLAGAGTFLLLRALGARRMPAYISGLLYMFAGYLLSYVYAGHDGRAIVATLAPLALFALHRGVHRGALHWFVLAGVVAGSAMLSFQIQNSYYLLLAAGLWFLFLLWDAGLFGAGRALLGRVGGAALGLAIAFGLNAVNFLPFLGYVGWSPRGGEGRGYEYSTSWSMPPEEIIGLAVPERIGVLDAYWGLNPFKLHTEYAGALTILLVVVGIYLLRRNRYALFFGALALLAATFAFGGYTPIYRLYYELLPGTAKFRAPSLAFFLISLALSVIAGLALDRLAELRAARTHKGTKPEVRGAEEELRMATRIGLGVLGLAVLWGLVVAASSPEAPLAVNTPEALREAREAMNHPAYVGGIWRFVLFLALSAGAVFLWLRRSLSTRAALVVLAVVAVADLWAVGKRFVDEVPEPGITFAPDEVANFLRSQPGPFRVFVLPDLPQDNYLTLFGIELVAGEHGNQLQTYNEFLGTGESTYTDLHNMNDPAFLALANARYLVTRQQIEAPFLTPVFQGRTRSGQIAYVYENRVVLPRAFLVPAARVVPQADGALAQMKAPGFDPAREVLLYGDAAPLRPTRVDRPAGARVVRYEPDEVEVAVDAPAPAYLVLTDNYYPGWTADIDGQPVEVFRADHTFRAVPVPAGSHTVRFRFEPEALRVGLLIYAGLLVLLAAYGAWLWSRHRREDVAPAG